MELFSGAPVRGHVPVIMELQTNQPNPRQYTEKLDISKINWDSWTQSIESDITVIREQMETEVNPYILWNKLNGIITKATDNHGEKKKISQYSKPYWTSSLTTASKKLQTAKKSYSKRNTDANLQKLMKPKKHLTWKEKQHVRIFWLIKQKH